MKNLRKRSQ